MTSLTRAIDADLKMSMVSISTCLYDWRFVSYQSSRAKVADPTQHPRIEQSEYFSS